MSFGWLFVSGPTELMLDGVSSAAAPVKPTVPHGTVLELTYYIPNLQQ